MVGIYYSRVSDGVGQFSTDAHTGVDNFIHIHFPVVHNLWTKE